MKIRLKGDTKCLPKKTIDLLPGLTVLIGCNGAGKTTVIDGLYEALRFKDDMLVFSYNDRIKGGSSLIPMYICKGHMRDAAAVLFSSEGERIWIGLTQFLYNVKEELEANPGKNVAILFDAIDSGMSVDRIKEFKRYIHRVLLNLKEHRSEVYIVVAANSYHMCKDELCFDVTAWKDYYDFTYTQYEDIIDKSRMRKDKRDNKKMKK